jgi:hypothetical protein
MLDESASPAGTQGSLRFRIAAVLAALGARAASCLVRYEAWLVPAAVIGFVFLQARPLGAALWFDEMFTFYIARLPDIGQVLRAQEANPPMNYLLSRVCMRWLGETEFAMRLPSIVAFGAAMLAAYFFVRRRCGAVYAFFGMVLLATCGMAAYGVEARPYALMLGFTGLTLVSWQAATEDGHPRVLPLIGVALGIAGAVFSHHFGVLQVGIPLLFGEGVRLWKRRRLDFPLYLACAAGLSTIALTVPFARQMNRVMFHYVHESANFWARPHLSSIRTYGNTVNLWLAGAFLVLLWLMKPAPTAPANRAAPAHEIAAALGLAVLVPVVIGFTWFATGYYVGRYAIGAAMGISILAAFAAHYFGLRRSHIAATASLCVVGVLVASAGAAAMTAVHRFTRHEVARLGANPILDTAPGSDPIVMASATAYAPEWWYAPASLRERLHYLADVPFAVRQPDFLPELALVVNRSILPSPVDDYRQFLSAHRRFLLHCSGEPRLEWTRERLLAEGWKLTLIRRSGNEKLFLAEAPGR